MCFDRQDIFDRALAHLRAQGKPALNGDGPDCLYRTPEGLKCAIGGLIPDMRYHPGLENSPASAPDVIEAMGYSYDDLSDDDTRFLRSLQIKLHDYPARCWSDFLELVEEGAAQVAERWELTYAPA